MGVKLALPQGKSTYLYGVIEGASYNTVLLFPAVIYTVYLLFMCSNRCYWMGTLPIIPNVEIFTMRTSQFIRILPIVFHLSSTMSPAAILEYGLLAAQSQVICQYIPVYPARSERIRLEYSPVHIRYAPLVTLCDVLDRR